MRKVKKFHRIKIKGTVLLTVLNLIKDACKINYLDTKKFFATSNLLQILKKEHCKYYKQLFDYNCYLV